MFEGDSADMCAGIFPLVSMGGRAERNSPPFPWILWLSQLFPVAFYLLDQKHQINSDNAKKSFFTVMASQNVCKFNEYGYCIYLEKCRKMHMREIC